MAQIEIFRAGTHQPMQGAPVTISGDDLAGIAAAYDAALHEAPVVAGHPVHDAPAYGWVKGLSVKDGVLLAETGEMDADFEALVKAGRFRKVSASFYKPDSPANPKPGGWHLRHVGFLGATPPAVKGLRNASFADGETGVADFADAMDAAGPLARFMRRVREWMLTQPGGMEAADAIAPDWEIESLAATAAVQNMNASPAFLETHITEEEKETRMADEKHKDDLAAQAAALKQREADLAAQTKQFDARQAAFAEREKAARHDENAALITGLVQDGRVAPAIADSITAFMDALDDTQSVSFGEGDAQTPLDYFRALLAKAGPVIDFGERAAGDDASAEFADGDAVGRAARAYIHEQAALGVHVGPVEAVAHVTKGKQK